VAGVTDRGECVRPVIRGGGIHRERLYAGSELIIRPRARVEFDFQSIRSAPPHVEDKAFAPEKTRFLGMCDDAEWEGVLRSSLFPSVAEVFDGELNEPHWVEPGAPTRSLGTILPATIDEVQFEPRDQRIEHRLRFTDAGNHSYKGVKVNDLAFQAFAQMELSRVAFLSAAAGRVLGLLQSADRVYLRLGLARPWHNLNTGRKECWMQVTGIHTFPDYLKGKTFADF